MSNPITQAFYFGLIFCSGVGFLFWASESPGDPYPSRWAAWRERRNQRYGKRVEWRSAEEAAEEEAAQDDETPETGNEESDENVIAEPKQASNERFPFPDSFAVLAALVQAGKIGETEGLKLAFGVSPGSSARYKVARGRLTEALAQAERPHFPPLTPAQQESRRALGLDA